MSSQVIATLGFAVFALSVLLSALVIGKIDSRRMATRRAIRGDRCAH